MPVARRPDAAQPALPATRPPWEDPRRVAAMLRIVLTSARFDHLVWGSMLQGPPAIERLHDDDLRHLVKLFERWRNGQ